MLIKKFNKYTSWERQFLKCYKRNLWDICKYFKVQPPYSIGETKYKIIVDQAGKRNKVINGSIKLEGGSAKKIKVAVLSTTQISIIHGVLNNST